MKDFFSSRKFTVLACIFCMLVGFFLHSLYLGETATAFSNIFGAMLSPLSTLSSIINQSTGGALEPLFNVYEMEEEIARLEEENRLLTEQLVEYNILKTENEQFREFLEIKERNEDFVFEPATVIARSPDANFGTFIINVGSYHDVSPRDPVITPEGLVGIVTHVSFTYSEVSTVLDPAVNISVISNRTLDTGVVNGDVALASNNEFQLSFLSRDSGISVGDIITTSGAGGALPAGLVVGTVKNMESEVSGLSLYGIMEPVTDIDSIKSVTVIKDYAGQAVVE